MDSIELNKEYKLNIVNNSSLKLMLLRYSFKPSSIDNNIPGKLEIDNDNNNDYNITLFTKSNKEEKFKSQSHHIIKDKNNINEYVLLHNNNDDEITLVKPFIDVYNIKHIQEREYVYDQGIINTAIKEKRKKTKSTKSNRILLAEAMLTKKKVEKPKTNKKSNNKKLNDRLIKIDSKLEEDMKIEGWIFDKNKYIGMKCRKFYHNDYTDGIVIAYLPADINDGIALWFYLHDDNDYEDLEEHEIIQFNKYYEQDLKKDPNISNKRQREENIDDSESENENENLDEIIFGK
jgi:hypothetical protein